MLTRAHPGPGDAIERPAATAGRLGALFAATDLAGSKPEQYAQLLAQARALMAGEPDRNRQRSNLSALVYHALPQINWAGFYFFDGTELVVGPFQGLPACVRIPLDKGVCGAARAHPDHPARRRRRCLPGPHCLRLGIALGTGRAAASRRATVGVFDLDSPVVDRFDADDQRGLEALARAFVESLA